MILSVYPYLPVKFQDSVCISIFLWQPLCALYHMPKYFFIKGTVKEKWKGVYEEKWLNLNNNWSKPKLLRLLCDIVVFRLVPYLLNFICLNLRILYKIWYIPIFVKILHSFFYQFLETGTLDRTRKGFDHLLSNLGFKPIPPFIFPLKTPY